MQLSGTDPFINAIRFATAFFGKGQFVPQSFERRGDEFVFRQTLEGPYYQPLEGENLTRVGRNNWSSLRMQRKQSEVCRMTYEGKIRVRKDRIEISLSADGTSGVPLAWEISLREGQGLNGVVAAPHVPDACLLKDGFAAVRAGSDRIQFGPGRAEHAYTQVRGAHDKLSGPGIYLTAYTPFRHTLNIRLG